MGGSPNLLMPVTPAYTASWASHTRRSPRSTEPGTDLFVPIGTPVYAPADGVIYGRGETIGPATGRWVGIDLDIGLRWRGMHFSRLVRTAGRVRRGDLIAYSGASGYGHEDWSRLSTMPAAHVHVTLWPSHLSIFGYRANGSPYTVDFMQYVGGEQAAGGGSTPPKGWDEMATQDEIMAGFRKIVKEEVVAEVAKAVKQNARSGAYKIVGIKGPVTRPGPNMKLVGPEGEADLTTDDEVRLVRRHVQATPYVADQPWNPKSKAVTGEELFTASEWAIVSKVLARMKPAKVS